jgi:hypothetical protein
MRGARVTLLVLASLACTASAGAQASIFPEWAGREVEVLQGDREGLIGDAELLFAQSTQTPAGPAFEGVILCRIHVDEPNENRWDSFADPDLRLVMQAGRTRLTAWGPENSRGAYLSFAGLSLRSGTQVSFRVFDRDVTGDELIETLPLRFDGGWPWTMHGRHTQLECRPVDAALAAARATEGERAAEQALEALTQAAPNLAAADLGRSPALTQAQSGVVRVMTYRGTRDAAARALRTRIQAATAAFERALRTQLTEARRSSPGLNTWLTTARGGGIRLTAFGCGERALTPLGVDPNTAACVAVLETRGDTSGLQADVVDSFGVTPGTLEITGTRALVRFPIQVDPRRMLLRVGAPELQTVRLR